MNNKNNLNTTNEEYLLKYHVLEILTDLLEDLLKEKTDCEHHIGSITSFERIGDIDF